MVKKINKIKGKRKLQDDGVLPRFLLCFYCILENNFKKKITNEVHHRKGNKITGDISAKGLSLSYINRKRKS